MTFSADQIFPPAAYVIGAPKCGTTALAAYLAEHPAVAFARSKEPHYFADDLAGLKLHADAQAYRAGFPIGEDTALAMEGSVWYLYSQTAVAAIEAVRPDAKYIVMLRDPLAMAASLHRQLLNAFDEDIADFAEAWRASGDRARGARIPRLCRAPSTLIYTRTCALGAQIDRFFAQVPPERRLVMFQEELQADSGAVYRRALAFLGLPDDGRMSFPKVNEAAAPRSAALHLLIQRGGAVRNAVSGPIKRLLGVKSLGVYRYAKTRNLEKAAKPTIGPDLAAEIAGALAADVDLLGRTLGRDVAAEFGWFAEGAGTRAPVAERAAKAAGPAS